VYLVHGFLFMVGKPGSRFQFDAGCIFLIFQHRPLKGTVRD
jgi:hypothetical protein